MLNKTSDLFTEKFALSLLSLSAAVYVFLFYSICWLKYRDFAYIDFDLAIHDQIIWNILHGRIFNSILGVDFLGNHAHFISFLVAPLYWFFPHPLFLLFLQTLFLAAGVFPLYALARLYHDHFISLIIGLIYLLYPGLGYTNLYEFHPTCFATFFLLCTAYYFYKEEFPLFNVFMILSLLCQENIALIFIMWGIYACILKRPWQWVWWPSFLGLVYFLLCVYVILPGFNKGTFNFFSIYGPLGSSLGEVMRTCILNPVTVIKFMFGFSRLHFLFQLFESLIFIPFFSPLALLPAFLIFIQHLLSVRLTDVSIHYHYTAELIPFIFTAFILGFKKVVNLTPKFKYLGWLLLLNAFIVNLAIGPHLHLIRGWKWVNSDYRMVQKEELLEEIPKNTSVVSTFEFLSHLSHHPDLYSFHHLYSGYFTLFTKRYHLPDNVQYALIDFNDHKTFLDFYKLNNYQNIDDFLVQGNFGVLDVQDSMVLFEKGIKNNFSLFNSIKGKALVSHPVNLIVDDRIKLLGYDASLNQKRIHLVFYWDLLKLEKKDVNLLIAFSDQNGHIIDSQLRPICYRIWPTQAWKAGETIEEHQYITVPPNLKGRLKWLIIKFYDYKTKKILPTDSKDFPGAIKINVRNDVY